MTTTETPVCGFAWARLVSRLRIKPMHVLTACDSVERAEQGRQAMKRWERRLESAAAAGRAVGLGYVDGPADSCLTYVRGRVLAVREQHCVVQALPEFGGQVHRVHMAAIAGMRVLNS